MLSRHRLRDTWETQGGHIEVGETVLDAAKRELYEESGVVDAVLYPVFDYLGYTDSESANGAVFLADVKNLGSLPESEIAEVRLVDAIDERELTYPFVTPFLLDKAIKTMT